MISNICFPTRRMIASILVVGLAILASGQKLPDKCPPTDRNQSKIKYRLGKSSRSVEGPPSLLIHISIKPKNFNREDMLTLAHQLNRDFCNEQIIAVLIFDSHRSAKSFAPPGIISDLRHPHSETHDRDMKSLRGSYYLDRTAGKESIRFNSVPGKPTNEIKIDLGSTPSP